MQDKIELSLLMDYYGAFLTDNQRELVLMSVDSDFSLSEIAERRGISKQGVRDGLLRGEKQLCDMESRLGLIAKDRRLHELAERLKSEITGLGAGNASEIPNAPEGGTNSKVGTAGSAGNGRAVGSEGFSRAMALVDELIKITEGTDGI